MAFKVNVSSNVNIGKLRKFGGKKRKISPAEEYWLNRILRNHSHRIFIIIFMFLAIILATVIVAALNPSQVDVGSGSESSSTSTSTSKSKKVIIQDGKTIIEEITEESSNR